MTNKELLNEISAEMKDLHDEREKKLEEVEKSEYPDGLKKQMRKEIMDNFYAKMEEFKERPWYDAAIKSARHEWSLRWKLKKIEKQRDKIQKEYEIAQIAHRWKIEQKTAENKENIEIPQKLKDFREKWEKNIDLDEDIKEKIIDAVNKIQKWAKEESDWSMLVEFELWWKAYKTLDVNVAKHSNSEYLTSYKYDRRTKNEVKLSWMRWDDTRQRKNRTLAEYVDKEKKDRKMEIRTVEFQRDLINKLWDSAGLTKMSDKIAMWMYLTWNYGYYWWTMWNHEKSNPKASSRSKLEYYDNYHDFYYNYADYDNASLCLIACE